MRIIRKEDIRNPFVAPLGEKVFEMIGRPKELGGTAKHSFVHVVIPPGKSSPAHYHRISEETYYILNGKGHIIINGKTYLLLPGQACLITPGETHQIFADDEELNFLVVSAPAWDPSDTFAS